MFYNWINFGFSNSVQYRISSQIFNRYIRYNYLKYSEVNSATLLNNIISETTSLRNLMRNLIFFSSEIIIFIGIATIIFLYDFKSALFAISTMIISSFIYFYIFKKKTIRLGYERYRINKSLTKNILQTFTGFKIIKIFKKENFFTNNHKEIFSDFLKNNRLISLLGVLPRLWVEVFAFLSICLFIFFIIEDENYSINNLIPFLSLIALSTIRIIPSINKIITAIQTFRSVTVSIDVIYKDLLESKNKYTEDNKTNNISFNKDIYFNRLQFKYPKRKELIINNLNFKIKKGQLIGITGPSGSGKSTFADILSGLISPNYGEILVDNITCNLVSEDWRKKIGYVTQDTFLLDDTIKNNIALGQNNEEIDDEKIKSILEIVQLDKFILSLDEGINTIVGERGLKISGGQRQRLGIARALFIDPDFLLLDEPTSALDENNAIKIYDLLIKLNKSKTIIVISHNLYFKEKFDQILEMKDGNLIKII